MLFSYQRFYLTTLISVFYDLVEGGRDEEICVDPWSSQQQVIRRVSINDVTRHFCLQIPNLAFQFDLAQRMSVSGIEAIDCCLGTA